MITITSTDRGLRGDSLAWTPTAEHETATNTGSLILWGSSAYPRMDRADAVRGGYIPRAADARMLAVGYSAQDGRAITTGEPHPSFPGVNAWRLFDQAGEL